MRTETLWWDPLYRETAMLIYGSLIAISIFIWTFKRSSYFVAAWASVKSWLFVAPFLFLVLALPYPWPLVFLALVGVYSSKTFFQMTGMYHRNWFVLATYTFIFISAALIFYEKDYVYELTPMIFFAFIGTIPLLRNSATQMIQYMGLSLMAFIFFGWSFLHMGRLLLLEKGPYIVLYLYVLTEISEHASLVGTRLFGRHKLFSRISNRVTLEGMLVAVVFSVLVAWALRHLLPDRSEHFWVAAGLVAAIFGRYGDLILTVIRRDLGIKDTGIFIFGRGDILSRVDKLILVGPMYYYIYLYFVERL